jgi:hypothetical protein
MAALAEAFNAPEFRQVSDAAHHPLQARGAAAHLAVYTVHAGRLHWQQEAGKAVVACRVSRCPYVYCVAL